MTAADAAPPRRGAAVRRHGVHRFLGRLHEVLDGVSTDTAWALSPEELGQCLEEAYAAQARLAALTLGLVAQADRSDLAAHDGVPGLVAWLRRHARLAPAEAKRQVALATGLEERPAVRRALAAGAFPAASAAVVVEIITKLDTGEDADADLVARAEVFLTGEAHAHDTQALRRIADHLDEVVDPDAAEQRLAEALARAEAKAARAMFLRLRHDEATATSEGHFRVPLLAGITLQRMLDSLTNPARPDPIPAEDPDTGVRLTAEERRGHALVELLDRYPTGRLPKPGGSAPTVVVTMDLATLEGRLRAAHLDTGHAIGPGLARRLAARAGVIPTVLGGDSEVLDLGRGARLHTRKQRLAMLITQAGVCAADGCTRTATGADAHHLVPWHQGGPTSTGNGVLLCPRHHTYADHPDYTVTRLRPGRIRINRRC